MTKGNSREAGYRLILAEAERDVTAARIALQMRHPKAPARLREAESVRDRILRLLGSAPPAPFDSVSADDTMANDFGVDDEEAQR